MNCKLSINPYLGGYSAEVPPLPIPNRVVKLSIADGTALRCGRVGSRHFRELEEKSPGSLVFVSATLLICLPFHKAACILPVCLYPPAIPRSVLPMKREKRPPPKRANSVPPPVAPRLKRAPYKKGGKDFFLFYNYHRSGVT